MWGVLYEKQMDPRRGLSAAGAPAARPSAGRRSEPAQALRRELLRGAGGNDKTPGRSAGEENRDRRRQQRGLRPGRGPAGNAPAGKGLRIHRLPLRPLRRRGLQRHALLVGGLLAGRGPGGPGHRTHGGDLLHLLRGHGLPQMRGERPRPPDPAERRPAAGGSGELRLLSPGALRHRPLRRLAQGRGRLQPGGLRGELQSGL